MTLCGQLLVLAGIGFGAKFGTGGSAWWLLPSVLSGMIYAYLNLGDWNAEPVDACH